MEPELLLLFKEQVQKLLDNNNQSNVVIDTKLEDGGASFRCANV